MKRVAGWAIYCAVSGCSGTGGDERPHEDDATTGATSNVDGDGASATGTGGSGNATTDGSSTGTAGGSETQGSTGGNADLVLPTPNVQFDYQLGESYPPPDGVGIVVRDREASPAASLYNICYVNGFQVQPHEEDFWLNEHPDLVLRDENGDPVIDAGWDEMILDTRTPEKREALAAIMGTWMAGCRGDGFDAVEIDNLDSYFRADGLLTEEGAVAYMALLSAAAHAEGLAIAQKNAAELVPERDAMGTDFVIVEECNRWNECGVFTDAYGDLVFVVEYRRQDFDAGCESFEQLSIVLRDLDLVGPSGAAYVYDAC